MNESQHSSGLAGGGHERRDANVRSLALFGVFMLGTLIVVCVGRWGVVVYVAGHQTLGPPASPFAQGRPMPAPGQPLLQAAPRQDLLHAVEQQQQLLTTYGWVDQKAGVVRVPIDRAMDLLLQRGLPVRGSGLPSGPSATGKTQARRQ
jgi:hypothetical protein